MIARRDAHVLKLELAIAVSICEKTDTPRALTVALLIKYREFDQLADLSIDPGHYVDAASFADDYLVTEILRKSHNLPVTCDAEQKALSKFEEYEAICAETNSRLWDFMENRGLPDGDITTALGFSQQVITEVLGPLTRSKLAYCESKMRFGPGATTSLSGVVTQGRKYSRRSLDVTPRCSDYRVFSFPEVWKQSSVDIRLQAHSKVRVVPKKSTIGRTILIEPDLNIFVQLGIGGLLREMLLKSGLDLNTQDRNQLLARSGSVCDHLCTMDLSGASDLVARSAVWLLLPFEWADLLHFARTDKYEWVDQSSRTFEKWSSMGNGYTFELETLLFYGVIRGCARARGVHLDETNFAVYGDDLIFPRDLHAYVQRTLEFLGFKVNLEKTFGTGRFRESCGTDWFDGVNVRPFFLRSDHHDFPTTCYIYANAIRRYANRRSGGSTCDGRYLPAWLRCITAIEPNLRYRIPEGYGDVGFVSNWDEAGPHWVPKHKWAAQWGGFTFRFRQVNAKMSIVSCLGLYIANLSGSITSFSSGKEALRGRYCVPVTKTGYTLQWPDLGAWH